MLMNIGMNFKAANVAAIFVLDSNKRVLDGLETFEMSLKLHRTPLEPLEFSWNTPGTP